MTVRVTNDGAVRTVTIDRPACRNAVDPATADALRAAFADFEADEGSAVAVLTGAGGHFCAGFDLKAVGQGERRYEPEGDGPMGPTRMLLSKPVIAAVEGYAVAGGLELALWCDLRVAAESATFGVFCRRWGVPLIDGGTVRLPRLVGQGRALEIIMTGRKVTADEALRIGLCEAVVPKGGARARAEAMAQEIARFPQGAVRADRASAIAGHGLSVQEALRQEWQRGVHTIATEGAAGAGRFAAGKGRGGDFSEI